MSSRHQEPMGLQLWLLPMQVFPSFAFDGRYGKQYHTVFAQKPSSCCGSLIDIFKGGWGRGDDSSPSHSAIHALTPLLGVSTLTSSFSAVLFPPKNKCDAVLTLFSVSPKTTTCFITPAGLAPTLLPVAGHTISFKRLECLLQGKFWL